MYQRTQNEVQSCALSSNWVLLYTVIKLKYLYIAPGYGIKIRPVLPGL